MTSERTRFGLVMVGQHRVGQFQLDPTEIHSSYHQLKNVQLQLGLFDPITGTAQNIHCLYVEEADDNKLVLVKDLGRGQLFAHGVWLGATQATMPSASFIARHALEECDN